MKFLSKLNIENKNKIQKKKKQLIKIREKEKNLIH